MKAIKKLLKNKPSYISSRNFAMVLLEVVGKGSASENVKALHEGIQEDSPEDTIWDLHLYFSFLHFY